MSRETEKVLKQMHEYLEQFDIQDEQDAEKKLQEFMKLANSGGLELEETPEMKSNDLLDQAFNSTKTKAKKLAKQALEIWSDNIDAECFLANFERNPIKRLKLFDAIVEKATKLLEKDGLFDEDCVGEFWGILETRPYMRARETKMSTLYELGRYSDAIRECEGLIHLCKNDNLGLRYFLMGLYCMLEKFDEAEKLYEKYKEDSPHMLFAMAILYYKKGDYTKSKKFIKKLNTCNKYIYGILHGDNEVPERAEYYAIGSVEEADDVIKEFLFLLRSTPSFGTFVGTVLG